MSFFLKRLREPSSWAGLALVLQSAAAAAATKDPSAIAGVLGGIAAIIAPEGQAK